SLDPETGRPDVDPAHKPGTGKRADFCPNAHGGKNWPPIAFSPKTRMIYIPANNNICGSNMGTQVQYTPGRPFVGIGGSQPFTVPGADHSEKFKPGTLTPASVYGRTTTQRARTGVRCWLLPVDWCSAAGPVIASSMHSMHPPANCSGSFPPIQEFWRRPHHLPSTVSNTSPYSPAGAEIRAECRRRSIVPFRASFRRFRR